VDWRPFPGSDTYNPAYADKNYTLKGAAYLVCAPNAMEDKVIVSSVTARIARSVTAAGGATVVLKDADQDAVITDEISTFTSTPQTVAPHISDFPAGGESGGGEQGTSGGPKTGDDMPLYIWLAAMVFAMASLALLRIILIFAERKGGRQS
jgi:hypothetical protein